ncbi:hypothetical protein [uncultured Caulobacter sp.]|uniref:hypothetical protein n=1 Tax=uncultured Caulobacter sp. TaxID=158749 RepID=UPI0026058C89|nr:hypothetical protein [uncultured Caulobacter sp.]
MTSPPDASQRLPLRPVHIALIAVLVAVLALLIVGWSYAVMPRADHGGTGAPDADRTTPAEAQARSAGQDPRGSNTSQDAYTSQNQSRRPANPPD